MDEDYPYELVHPKAFAMVAPTADMLEDGEQPYPSVTICLSSGKNLSNDDLAHGTRTLAMTALFATWNPGQHGQDVLIPSGDGTYKHRNASYFQENADGWRDAWNFVDTALNRIESVDYIGGLLVDQKKGVDFSAVEEAYPFWFAQISFTLVTPIVMSHTELEDFL